MASGAELPVLRIGELSRRTGVPVPTIRGWERRYQYPVPSRTSHGYRLYSEADVRGLTQLCALLASGMAVSQAVEVMRVREADERAGSSSTAAAVQGEGAGSGVTPGILAERLALALLAFDSAGAHELLDRAFGAFGVEVAMCDVSLAAVREIGTQWEQGAATIAQEHFASNLVRGRIWGLARGWDQGSGRRIVLAVTGGDQHDLPLLVLGILLRERGWRVTWIGADTPAAVLLEVSKQVQPELVLVSMTGRRPKAGDMPALQQLTQHGVRLAIAGPRATARLAEELGALLVAGGPDEVARDLEVV